MTFASVALKVGLPLVLAGGGIAAVATAPDPADARAQRIWIDSPAASARLQPGTVSVVAHAADGTRLTQLTLTVDGRVISTVGPENRFDTLVSASFAWEATRGYHQLRVLSGDTASLPVDVVVGAVAATPSRHPSPSPTPTSTPSASSPSPSPSLATPTSTSPAPLPSATALPVTIESLDVAVPSSCPDQVTISARVSGATRGYASFQNSAGGSTTPARLSGRIVNGSFVLTFDPSFAGELGELYGTYRVSVVVSNATGQATATTRFSVYCGKN